MRSIEETRVARALKEALQELKITTHTEFPQLHIRAYHFINTRDYDKTYHLCIPLEQGKRLCYRSRDHYAYAYTLTKANEANNLARKGKMVKARMLFRRAINYFIERSDEAYIEERIAPYTFRITMLRSDEAI
jgi:hypothetical protein